MAFTSTPMPMLMVTPGGDGDWTGLFQGRRRPRAAAAARRLRHLSVRAARVLRRVRRLQREGGGRVVPPLLRALVLEPQAPRDLGLRLTHRLMRGRTAGRSLPWCSLCVWRLAITRSLDSAAQRAPFSRAATRLAPRGVGRLLEGGGESGSSLHFLLALPRPSEPPRAPPRPPRPRDDVVWTAGRRSYRQVRDEGRGDASSAGPRQLRKTRCHNALTAAIVLLAIASNLWRPAGTGRVTARIERWALRQESHPKEVRSGHSVPEARAAARSALGAARRRPAGGRAVRRRRRSMYMCCDQIGEASRNAFEALVRGRRRRRGMTTRAAGPPTRAASRSGARSASPTAAAQTVVVGRRRPTSSLLPLLQQWAKSLAAARDARPPRLDQRRRPASSRGKVRAGPAPGVPSDRPASGPSPARVRPLHARPPDVAS